MYVLKLYIYNMHTYVYCSFNESQNECLNFEFFIQIRKLLIDYKNGHFSFEHFYMNMKTYISTQQILHLTFK